MTAIPAKDEAVLRELSDERVNHAGQVGISGVHGPLPFARGAVLQHLGRDRELLAKHAAGIVPVASGNNTVSFSGGTVHGYSVRHSYNLVTGLGTVNGQDLVPELARSA